MVWNRSVPTNIDAQEEKDIMKMKTRQITVTAIMLAICIASQFFKNLSVYITGPIINAALILTVLYAGLACGIILSINYTGYGILYYRKPGNGSHSGDVPMHYGRKCHPGALCSVA